MDCRKQEAVNASIKKENVSIDGLTKKQRRALLVQTRGGQEASNQVAPVEAKDLKTENRVTKNDKATNSKGKEDKKENTSAAQLSEKDLRRLEWEKKQAEQKLNAKQDDKGLSKAELRVKRREQQEAQRLKKTAANTPLKKEIIEKVAKTDNKPVKKTVKKASEPGKSLLANYFHSLNNKSTEYERIIVNYPDVHPVFVRLGIQYGSKRITGSNARCLSLLIAIRQLINDLETPSDQEFSRFFEVTLHSCISFLQYCRPFGISMTNALRHFQEKIREIQDMEEDDAKIFLTNCIRTYITEDLFKATDAISLQTTGEILDSDVILIYGESSVVKKILLTAHKAGKRFVVMVTDARPFLEGQQMLQKLIEAGIECYYVQITTISYFLTFVTKVFLGAHGLFSNGWVMSRIGSAQIAMVARSLNKPVLICCETYKFSETVKTQCFVNKELGDPKLLCLNNTLKKSSCSRKNEENLKMLNLLYDVTPLDLVTALLTELGTLPCGSVAAVLRLKPTE